MPRTPARDHQHAAIAAGLGASEERHQTVVRLGLGQAVQIEARIDRIVAAPQLEPGSPIQIDRARRIEASRSRQTRLRDRLRR